MKSTPATTSSNEPANPFVAALGHLPESIPELVRRMTPKVEVPLPEMRTRGVMERFAAVGVLEDVYVPTSRDIKLALRLTRMIIRGYNLRPPTAEYWLNHNAEATALADFSSAPPAGLVTAITGAVQGTSGMGKSTAVAMGHSLFPPVAYHDQAKHPLLPKTQVTTLTVTCPINRTPKAFIVGFFGEIYLLTGIDYLSKMPRGASDDAMIIEMGRVTRLHRIGLLVFDEVQQVVGGDDRLKHLLVRLTNTVKVPILFVGTFKSQCLLNKELATARRMLGGPWVPFPAKDDDWNHILTVLWQYQVTRTPTPLDQPLREKMTELTCGIPALAKALYGFAQEHLIINAGKNDPELITPELLEVVFEAEMSTVAPAMGALRTGCGLETFDDLLPDALPQPSSWGQEKALKAATQSAFTDSALKTAKRSGKLFAMAQILGPSQ